MRCSRQSLGASSLSRTSFPPAEDGETDRKTFFAASLTGGKTEKALQQSFTRSKHTLQSMEPSTPDTLSAEKSSGLFVPNLSSTFSESKTSRRGPLGRLISQARPSNYESPLQSRSSTINPRATLAQDLSSAFSTEEVGLASIDNPDIEGADLKKKRGSDPTLKTEQMAEYKEDSRKPHRQMRIKFSRNGHSIGIGESPLASGIEGFLARTTATDHGALPIQASVEDIHAPSTPDLAHSNRSPHSSGRSGTERGVNLDRPDSRCKDCGSQVLSRVNLWYVV